MDVKNKCPFFAGHIDHAARVMRVITWNKSFKGIPNGDATKDEYDIDEYETHATVLDKLLAWEKKLYDEMKVLIASSCPFAFSWVKSWILYLIYD